MADAAKPQLDKFKEGARELETDDDEARFDERVKKLVTHKPLKESHEPTRYRIGNRVADKYGRRRADA